MTQEKRSRLRGVALAVLAIVIIFVALFVAYWSLTNVPGQTQAAPSHEELVNYALSLINADRQTQQNVLNVSLGLADSAQRHAEDMLSNSYFSHWDLRGLKPYARYTLAGGKGAVRENIAAEFGSISDVKGVIEGLEWSMMFDDAGSGWGHRGNIVDPFHNEVGIGIAYDNNSLYLVEDFEDDYVDWAALNVTSTEVAMQGHCRLWNSTIQQVAVYFDNVANLTAQQLADFPYNGSYTVGTLVGSVLPSGRRATEGITIAASAWVSRGKTSR